MRKEIKIIIDDNVDIDTKEKWNDVPLIKYSSFVDNIIKEYGIIKGKIEEDWMNLLNGILTKAIARITVEEETLEHIKKEIRRLEKERKHK